MVGNDARTQAGYEATYLKLNNLTPLYYLILL